MRKAGTEIRGKLHAETIIVGGGVIGCAIACELATRGHDVLLVERARIAGELPAQPPECLLLTVRNSLML